MRTSSALRSAQVVVVARIGADERQARGGAIRRGADPGQGVHPETVLVDGQASMYL